MFLSFCSLKIERKISEEMRTHFSTVWVVTDLETAEGRLLAYNAIRHLKRSYTMRVAIINNPKDVSVSDQCIFDIVLKKFPSSSRTDSH